MGVNNLNEGWGVLRFGAYGPPVIDRLRWMARVLAPLSRPPTGFIGSSP